MSSTVAGWLTTLLLLINQFALVPIMLRHWSIEQFGMWVTVQAAFSLVTVCSFGLKQYLEFEFLRFGLSERNEVSNLLGSSLPTVIAVGLTEATLVTLFAFSGALDPQLSKALGVTTDLFKEGKWLLLLLTFNWVFVTCAVGTIQRSIVPFGYYARNAWFAVANSGVTLTATTIAVVKGSGLIATGLIQQVSLLAFSIIVVANLRSILKRESLRIMPETRVPMRGHLLRSLLLSMRTLLSSLQQQGLRVPLASTVGVYKLTSFSTMRTLSNVGLQGVNTVSYPMTPELIRVFNLNKTEEFNTGTFALRVITTYLLGFGLIVLQVLAPWLYNTWTLGKTEYDDVVFAMFSITLLLFGYSQPMLAVVRGTNSLLAQFIPSAVGASLVVGSAIFIAPILGIRAVAYSLVVSELISTCVTNFVGYRILRSRKLVPNWQHTMLFLGILALSIASLLALTIFTHSFVIVLLVLSIQFLTLPFIWRAAPTRIRTKFKA